MTDDTSEGSGDQSRNEAGLPSWNARTDLYVSGATSPTFQTFPLLATAWLNELARIVPSTYGWKVSGDLSYPPDYGPHENLRRVRLKNGQVLTLRFNAYQEYPRDDNRWFRRVEVRGFTSRTDKAALAALSVLEGSGVRKTGIDRIRQRLQGEQVYLEAEEDKLLAFARALLGYHRADLVQTSDEGIEILVGVCQRAATVAESARKLINFLEFGAGGRDTRPKIEDAELDVYAAELHDIADMSQLEVAEKLRLMVSDRDRAKGDHATAADMIKSGRQLFIQALGEDRWRRYVLLLRDEYERR